MTWKLTAAWAILVSMLPILILCSCESSGSEPDPSIEALIEQGKQALTDNNYFMAQGRFDTVLAEHPDHAEALYGRVLAEIQHGLGVADSLLRFSSDLVNPYESAPCVNCLGFPPAQGGEPLLSDLLALNESQQERLTKLKQADEVTFTLEAYPVVLGGQRLFELGTEWDRADVYLIDALTKGQYALLTFLDSQAWEDEHVSPRILDIVEGDSEQPITSVLAQMLNRYPSFLGLTPEGRGEQRFAQARDALTTMASDILTAYSLLERESDDQSDDVLTIGADVQGVQHLLLQGTFYPVEGEPFGALPVLWAGQEYGIKLTAQQIEANLAGEAGKRIRLEHDIIVPVAMVLDLFRQTTGIKGLMQIAEGLLGLLGVEIDPVTLSILDAIQAQTAEEFPTTFVSLLAAALFDPSVIELDVGAFLSRPVGFRFLLPNWDRDVTNNDADIYYEFECARLAWRDTECGETDVVLTLHDPFLPTDDKPQALLQVVRSGDGAPLVVDVETAVLEPAGAYPGLYQVVVPLAPVGMAAEHENGVLERGEATDEIVATYVEQSDPLAPIEIVAAYSPEGSTERVWTSTLSCQADTSRDSGHFHTTTPDFVFLPDDGDAELQSPYPPLEADAYPGSGMYLPFRSGSLNNLLWVDLGGIKPQGWNPGASGFPDALAKTDIASLNLFVMFLLNEP